jgi:Phasin protein
MFDAVFPTTALPGAGLAGAFGEIQQRNLAALARAQKAAVDGMHALAQAQGDALEATLREMGALPGTVLLADPRTAIAAPFDLAGNAIRNGTARMNRLGELAAVTGADVAAILQDRLLAALEETKAALLGLIPAGL